MFLVDVWRYGRKYGCERNDRAATLLDMVYIMFWFLLHGYSLCELALLVNFISRYNCVKPKINVTDKDSNTIDPISISGEGRTTKGKS